ncbi:Transcriptional adapter ada2 [Terramyces sp. JEL0728]|nr:Transcriptional adapter ada2 [Terramyces sp. JEL0728]
MISKVHSINTATIDDFGQKYHCDSCSKDITHLIILRCAICADFDLCIDCFSKGTELKDHKKNHDYRVIDVLDFPIFEPDWGADEELLLVEGLEMFGIGNWEHISEHIGTKNSKECNDHYQRVYVDAESWPYPDMSERFEMSPGKRLRARPPGYQVTKLPKYPRAPASQPVNHEIAGYMPGRKEFEHEFENDAEQIVKDIEITEEDTKEEIDLKAVVMDIYNTTLDRRAQRKKIVFDRGLTDFKRIQSIEKKRPKEEKELYQKYRIFAKMMTQEDFHIFMEGLTNELRLRQKIYQLQEYIRMGVTTMKEANDYEKDKQARINSKAAGYMTHIERSALRRSSSKLDDLPLTPVRHPLAQSMLPHKVANALDISKADGVDLLSDGEKMLCSTLRIFPRAYISIKDTVLKEYASKGVMRKRNFRALVKIDGNKSSRIYDYFVEMGWLTNKI